jgi:predicted nucleotide-binding protein
LLDPDVEHTRPRSRVFLVHGRDRIMNDAMFELLRAFGLHAIEWEEAVGQTGDPNPFIGDVLDAAFAYANAVVVLFTPDESVVLREDVSDVSDATDALRDGMQARPNVLFEAGMAMGRAPTRTVIVEVGKLRPFSDIAGRHVLRFDGSESRRRDLARRLGAAGCEVSLRGRRWRDVPFPEMPDAAAPAEEQVADGGISAHLRRSPSAGRAYLILENHGTDSLEHIEAHFDEGTEILFLPNPNPLPYLVPGQRASIPFVILRALPERLRLSVQGTSGSGKRFTRLFDIPFTSPGV